MDDLTQRVLAGDRPALARVMTLLECDDPAGIAAWQALYPRTGRAQRIGLTGPPGVGKSTLVSQLARHYRQQDQTAGIVAVDPTSPLTGGALLGDRVRMGQLATDPGVFVRSMASRGQPGGLAAQTAAVADVLDAAGMDRVLIETVGVGQEALAVVGAAHTTVLVGAPGQGDEVQALKAGLLELADVLVVNQADRDGAPALAAAWRWMVEGGSRHARETGWQPPVIETVATTGEGYPRWQRPSTGTAPGSRTAEAGSGARSASLASGYCVPSLTTSWRPRAVGRPTAASGINWLPTWPRGGSIRPPPPRGSPLRPWARIGQRTRPDSGTACNGHTARPDSGAAGSDDGLAIEQRLGFGAVVCGQYDCRVVAMATQEMEALDVHGRISEPRRDLGQGARFVTQLDNQGVVGDGPIARVHQRMQRPVALFGGDDDEAAITPALGVDRFQVDVFFGQYLGDVGQDSDLVLHRDDDSLHGVPPQATRGYRYCTQSATISSTIARVTWGMVMMWAMSS